MPKLSLIIAVYKNIRALALIFEALDHQDFQDFEVIVAEDNEGQEMARFIEMQRQTSTYTIKHIYQPDLGFLKNKALNRAIAASDSDYIVFLDGDCIPHRHFLQIHYRYKKEDVALFGRRVMLSPSLTNALYEGKIKLPLSFYTLLKYRCQKIKYAFYLPFLPPIITIKSGIWGCNWSIHKKNLLAVNGFDEDYTKPGIGEDTDIQYRLQQTGVKLMRIKNQAIQYHLHHAVVYTDTVENEQKMADKIKLNMPICKNGINQYLNF